MSGNEGERHRERHEDNPNKRARFLEETASEVIPLRQEHARGEERNLSTEDQPENRRIDAKSSIGIVALVLSILSLLIMPIILGTAGVITGAFARNREAKTMGNWAIVIGAISIVASLLFSPFM